jgi:phytanoyl-CoA hydroxylase
VLTQAQIDEYNSVGAIVVPDILTHVELAELRSVTDEFVERARGISHHDDVFDLEDSHTSTSPRVRRIKDPHLHHPAYGRLVKHPKIVAVLQAIWGPDIRFDTNKLNLKSANFGSPVEWHQDWAFTPHTNDDHASVGVMIDDMEIENGPLLIIPGTHKGPVFSHHANGRFCGAMDPRNNEVDYASAVPLLGKAGAITLHHVRLVHGSAANTSSKERRLLFLQYRAADAWPLLGPRGSYEDYEALMVAGTPPLEIRLERVPVRLPMPPAESGGSIYENQKGLQSRYFATVNDRMSVHNSTK